MDLYIHFGIYKTGSSFLQYLLVNSRIYLEHNKIYFPVSVNDKKMMKGLISPGNADGLENTLKNRDQLKCEKYLSKWFNQAKDIGCTTVLVSSEALVHQMAKETSLKVLTDAAKNVGFNKIHAMGFFRDLVDHALSTYKHRAKSGKIPDYRHWIDNIYETPQLLENLVRMRTKDSSIIWTFRKFAKDSIFLQKVFFQDWLQIDPPKFKGNPTVNESVTLSEVFLMNSIKKYYPLVTDYFVEELKKLPNSEKGKDKDLENHVRLVFFKTLCKKKSGMNEMNLFLNHEEQLVLLEKNIQKESSQKELYKLVFSERQIQLVLQKTQFFRGIQGISIIVRRKIVRLLPKHFIMDLIEGISKDSSLSKINK